MTEDRARLATTVPVDVDEQLRALSAAHRAPMSVLVSTLLRYGIARVEEESLAEALDEAIAEHKKQRAEIGRKAMDSRYRKDGT